MKECSHCRQTFSLDRFYKNPQGKFGVCSLCKSCKLVTGNLWRERNRTKVNQKAKEKRIPEKARLACQKWRQQNLAYDAQRQRERTALKLQRFPLWADKEKIKTIYENCPKGFHVDHIVPLKGKLVSGLHVEFNLQYLPALENIRKKNHYADHMV